MEMRSNNMSNYTFSYIKDEVLSDSKKPFVAFVSGTAQVSTLKRFSELLIKGAICPGVFVDNKKTKDNFMFTQFLFWDFDKGTMSSDEVIRRVSKKNISFILAASKNHLNDKGDGLGSIERFHLLIPLDEPLADIDYIKHLLNEIAKEFGILSHIDTACIDATRFFAKHKTILYINDTSPLIDTDEYAPYYQRCLRYEETRQKLIQEKREQEIKKSGDVSPEIREKAIEAYLLKTDEAIEGQGGDKQIFKVACMLYRLGATFQHLMVYNSTKCSPPFADATLNHKWKDAESKNALKLFAPSYIRKVANVR
jgi:hypothetical protein